MNEFDSVITDEDGFLRLTLIGPATRGILLRALARAIAETQNLGKAIELDHAFITARTPFYLFVTAELEADLARRWNQTLLFAHGRD